MANFQKSQAGSASLPVPQILKFEREDWTSFRTVEGLQQKAGVNRDKLRRLVLKEITDNALDAGAKVNVGKLSGGGYFIEDNGAGIDGSPQEIARLFSIARPMISSKLLRLPTRGALGNGLRVVAGAVLASDGSLVVITRNRRMQLRPEHDGNTTVMQTKAVKFPTGTRIEIDFGPAIPKDQHALCLAKVAIMMASVGESYAGRTSPFWYDVPQFHELLLASGSTPIRELVAALDGCTGGRAGEIIAEAGLGRKVCGNIDREQAERLLQVARDNARPVNPKRLGAVGADVLHDHAYAVATGSFSAGEDDELHAEIPFVVEAWVIEDAGNSDTKLVVCVNRTPIAGDIYASRENRDIDIFGCGISHTVAQAPKDKHFNIWLNVQTPYMPITSDGKEPDLQPFLAAIREAVSKAVRKARRPDSTGESQKDFVLDHLDEAIAEQGAAQGYRFNERRLFYGLRRMMLKIGEELKLPNFKAIITGYESEHGEIPLMYREPRGSIYHPHRGQTITLGTLMVEQYERPLWTFNKILYIEKEGANEALKEVRWAEHHDCAVLSSKGFSTRAARDLIDKLAEHDEPVTVFCAHDADGYGTVIYQTLQEATKARGARKIKIVNIGLEPWEAIAMGLEVETIEESKRRRPVADYVRERDEDEGEDWEEWLQTHRVELNAMTTPQLIAWLDQKIGTGKLIPPPEVLEDELAARVEDKIRDALIEKILRDAGLEGQVAEAIASIETPDADTLTRGIGKMFKQNPSQEWRSHIEDQRRGQMKQPSLKRRNEHGQSQVQLTQ
jgi:hypothetical protein